MKKRPINAYTLLEDVVNKMNNEYEETIVRCKDCKYWHPLFKPDGYCDCDDMWRSLEGETTEVEYIRTNEDFYCGYAER